MKYYFKYIFNKLPSDDASSLHFGSVSSFLLMAASAALGLLVHIGIARTIGVTEYGLYSLMLSWTTLFATFAQLGLDTVVTRLLPIYQVRDEWRLSRGLRRGSGRFIALTSLLMAAASTIWLLTHHHFAASPHARNVFIAGFLALPFITALQQDSAWLRAWRLPAASGLYNNLIRPIILIFIIIILFQINVQMNALSVTISMLFATFLSLLASRHHVQRAWPSSERSGSSEYAWRIWLRLGFPLALTSLLSLASNRLGILLVGGLLGPTQAGPYFAAVQLVTVASFGISAVNSTLAPMISSAYAKNDFTLLQKLLRKGAWMNFWITSFIVSGLAILGRWILSWFGVSFESAWAAMLILLSAEFINAIFGPVGFLMTMTKYEHLALWAFLSGAICNILIAALIIPILGMTGAALSGLFGTTVWNIFAFSIVVRKLGVNPTIFWNRHDHP